MRVQRTVIVPGDEIVYVDGLGAFTFRDGIGNFQNEELALKLCDRGVCSPLGSVLEVDPHKLPPGAAPLDNGDTE